MGRRLADTCEERHWQTAVLSLDRTVTTSDFPEDIYSESENVEVNTLANLGPLTGLTGICSTRFLEYAFTTIDFRVKVTVNPDGSWSHEEDTVHMVRGRAEPFHHTDRNTLTKIGEPTPNPLAQSRR